VAALSLVFDILARDNASGPLRNVGNTAGRTGQQLGQVEQSVGRLGGAMGKLGGVLKVAGLAFAGMGIAEFLTDSVRSLERIERINAQTTSVIKSTGGAAKVTAQNVFDLTGNLENLTATEAESIQQGANLLLTFTNIKNGVGANNQIFDQAVGAMTDMARALDTTGGANIDTSKTAIQLGKALNDPIKGVTALQRVGVSFTETQKDQIRGFVEAGDVMSAQRIILAELTKEFGGAGEAFARTTAGKIELAKHALGTFGETITGFVLPALGNLASKGADAFNALAEGFSSGEVTSGGFKGVMQGLGVAVKDLFGAVGDVAGVVGDTLGPAFKLLVPVIKVAFQAFGAIASVIGDVAGWFGDLPGPIKAGAVALGLFLLLRGPMSAFFTSLAVGITSTVTGMGLAVASTGIFRAAMGGLLTALGGPLGLAITGVTIGLGFLVDWMGKGDDATQANTQSTQDYAAALREANGVVTENVRTQAAKSAQDAGVLAVADKLGISLSTVTDAITNQGSALTNVQGALQTFIDQHTNAEGRSAQFGASVDAEGKAAMAAMEALNSLAGQSGTTASSQEQLARATAGAGTAAGAAQLSQQQLTTQLQDAADAASEAKQETDLYKTSLDLLTGANVSMIEVESHLQDALAAADGALKDMTGSVLQANGQFNLQSEAGRKAADVLLGVKDAGNQVIATMINQGASESDVRAKDAQLRDSFIHTAMQMGISRGAAEQLANQILGIPAERRTTITADTGPARTQLNGLINDYRGYQINLGLSPTFNRFAAAEGGILPGYTPGRDVHHFSSPTAGGLSLSGGEAIMRPEWTKAVGPSFVGRMNKLAKTSGVAGVRSGGRGPRSASPTSGAAWALAAMTAPGSCRRSPTSSAVARRTPAWVRRRTSRGVASLAATACSRSARPRTRAAASATWPARCSASTSSRPATTYGSAGMPAAPATRCSRRALTWQWRTAV
jgi:hypothetical protein